MTDSAASFNAPVRARSPAQMARLLVQAAWRRRWLLIIPILIMLPAGLAASKILPLNYVTRSLILLQESGETGPFTREPANAQFITAGERLAALQALLLSDRVLGGVLDDLGITDPQARAIKLGELRNTIWLESAGTNFVEIYHSGPNPTGLARQLENIMARFLEALVPGEYEPAAIQILLEKHARDLAAAQGSKTDLERRQAELAIDSPAAARARLAALDRQRQAKEEELRQAEEAVELARPAGVSSDMTLEQLEQEIHRAANPSGTGGEESEQPMRAQDIAPLRNALARRDGILSEQQRIAAAIETERRNIASYEGLEVQIAGKEREIASAQDQLDATRRLVESIRLRGATGILRAPELIRIVDPPRDPVFPTRSPSIYLLAALAAGALIGLALASIMEFLDTSLRDPGEFSKVAGAPVIARIGGRTGDPVLSDHGRSV